MTPRERRTVRLGVVAAAMILLYVMALDPYLASRAETRAKIEETEAQLTRLRSLERSLPAYRQRLAAAQATWNTEVRPRLLAGDLPAVAASALSGEVRRIGAQSFLEVERENVLASTDQDGLTSIPVQFSLRGDVYGLRDFLAALETSHTFLNLRELRVNSIAAGFNQGMTAAMAPLQLTVTVEGYLGGEPPPGEQPEAPAQAAGGPATGGATTGGAPTGGAAVEDAPAAPAAPAETAPAQSAPSPTAPSQRAPAPAAPAGAAPSPTAVPQQPAQPAPSVSNGAEGQQ